MNQSDIKAMRERLQARQAESVDRETGYLMDALVFVTLITLFMAVFMLA